MSTASVRRPGPYQVSAGLKLFLMIATAIGGAVFALGLVTDPTRAWSSFVLNHFYFMTLGLGGLFFAAIQWTTNAMWSAPIRRLSESFTAYLPVALVTFVILYFGIHSVYPWSHPEHVQGDLVLQGKAGWLSPGFFTIRNAAVILVWIFFAMKLVGNSILQDANGEYSYTAKNKVLSPIFLIVFALTYTMASFDQMMSLDPHWYSTMFGVYCFAGLFYANLAATCLLTIFLKRKGALDGIVSDEHLHDLGKFMFAFTIFWAYIGFSQFMLIWYANMPEETMYFIRRFNGNWKYVSAFLLLGKFLVPFFLLLPRDAKRNEKMLWRVGWFMMVAQWIDFMWVVQPEFFHEGPRVGWMEIGVTLGFVGIFGLVVARFLGRHSIVAVGDPRIEESVFHHHQ